MKKIVTPKALPTLITQLKLEEKSIVLVGGVFDIIHPGHIHFLNQSKAHGDLLFVLLESDKSVEKLKGKDRPIFNQNQRANVIEALSSVSFIVKLDSVLFDSDYYKLTEIIKPDIIAATKGDSIRNKKIDQAQKINAQFLEIDNIENHSSTDIIKRLGL